jgi:hypothetical protein
MDKATANSFSQLGSQLPGQSYFYFSFYYFAAVRPWRGEAED